MKLTGRIVGLAAIFITAGCVTAPRPPSYPTEPNIVFRSTVDMPALPPEPTMAEVLVPRESYVGIRYVPASTAAATVGDIEVVVEPSQLGTIRTTDFKGEPLLIQPAGLIAWIVVRNQSSHIVDLGQSLLQFEDDKGNEFAIAEGGWTGSTLAFIDKICESYASEASVLVDRYRRSLEPLLTDVRSRVAAARRQNDDDLDRYMRFVHEKHSPLFAAYVDEVNTYNRNIRLGAFSTPEDRRTRASELGLPPRAAGTASTPAATPALCRGPSTSGSIPSGVSSLSRRSGQRPTEDLRRWCQLSRPK